MSLTVMLQNSLQTYGESLCSLHAIQQLRHPNVCDEDVGQRVRGVSESCSLWIFPCT